MRLQEKFKIDHSTSAREVDQCECRLFFHDSLFVLVQGHDQVHPSVRKEQLAQRPLLAHDIADNHDRQGLERVVILVGADELDDLREEAELDEVQARLGLCGNKCRTTRQGLPFHSQAQKVHSPNIIKRNV